MMHLRGSDSGFLLRIMWFRAKSAFRFVEIDHAHEFHAVFQKNVHRKNFRIHFFYAPTLSHAGVFPGEKKS